MLLGAKRHNFTETNLKTGLESETALQKQTNKPKKEQLFLRTKLSAALKYKSTQLLCCSEIYI